MTEYCKQDVKLNAKLVGYLESKKIPENVLELEMEVAQILYKQEEKGFLLDEPKAIELYTKLTKEKQRLATELKGLFPEWYSPKKPGAPVFVPKRDNRTLGYTKGQAMTPVKLNLFNPGSEQQVEYWLRRKYNWKPKEFTPSGQAKLGDKILQTLEYPEAKELARYSKLEKISGYVGDGDHAWLKSVTSDGRVHGRVNTVGCVTGRMSHNSPNLGQVPRKGTEYSLECRELFIVPEDKVLVGIDASGLELRCLAHYMAPYDNGAYAKEVVDGDVHGLNQEIIGLDSRDTAKTFIYAFLYGAGVVKLATIAGRGPREGAQLKRRFLKGLPALGILLSDINRVVSRKGCLRGIDGRRIEIRSQHSALNFLLQSCGAIVMKQALVNFDYKIRDRNWKAEFVANVHDEWQLECSPEDADCAGSDGVQAIIEAGEQLGMRCQLDGEYKTGRNWSETH
jgi:DNA polymerase I-like protein with 3'-5' exonuclease and polymerase domains